MSFFGGRRRKRKSISFLYFFMRGRREGGRERVEVLDNKINSQLVNNNWYQQWEEKKCNF